MIPPQKKENDAFEQFKALKGKQHMKVNSPQQEDQSNNVSQVEKFLDLDKAKLEKVERLDFFSTLD